MDRVFEFNSNIFLDDRRFERARHCEIFWNSTPSTQICLFGPANLASGRCRALAAAREFNSSTQGHYKQARFANVYEIDEAALCSKKINLCGVKATPPCYKRHVQKVPVTSLRPPAAFQMLEIETAMTDGREHHRFRLPPDVLPTARAAIAEDEARFPAAVLY